MSTHELVSLRATMILAAMIQAGNIDGNNQLAMRAMLRDAYELLLELEAEVLLN